MSNLSNHFVVKWHEVAQTIPTVDCEREMTSKKSCNEGEFGSFEHLFFLFLAHNERFSRHAFLAVTSPFIVCTPFSVLFYA